MTLRSSEPVCPDSSPLVSSKPAEHRSSFRGARSRRRQAAHGELGRRAGRSRRAVHRRRARSRHRAGARRRRRHRSASTPPVGASTTSAAGAARRARCGHESRLGTPRQRASVALLRIDRMIRRIPREHPWFAADAQRLDSMTLEDFKNAVVWTAGGAQRDRLPHARAARRRSRARSPALLLVASPRHRWAQPLLDVPMLGARELGTSSAARSSSASSCERRFTGQSVLGEPVVAIEQDDDGVSFVPTERESRARYVVVALSPALAGRIRYSPPLPAARDALSAADAARRRHEGDRGLRASLVARAGSSAAWRWPTRYRAALVRREPDRRLTRRARRAGRRVKLRARSVRCPASTTGVARSSRRSRGSSA